MSETVSAKHQIM